MASKRTCPNCNKPGQLVAGVVLYPLSHEYKSIWVVVCWACNLFRKRGEGWGAIGRRHEGQWKRERDKWSDAA